MKDNLEAIELAERISKETPTREEALRLLSFSGWGGTGTYLNSARYTVGKEAMSIINLSSLSSYYTPPFIIDQLWRLAKGLGFKGGAILESSAGIGNMLALMPNDISENSSITAIELEPKTGNILSALYPDADVRIQGFQDTEIGNKTIDLAITNVPFVKNLRVHDSSGDSDLSKRFSTEISNFCIAKNVRKLREGGIGMFITTFETLDKSNNNLVRWVTDSAGGDSDFIGAFRLNNKTFLATGATADIIIVRKRIKGQRSDMAINLESLYHDRDVQLTDNKGKTTECNLYYNGYFHEHPECMGGVMAFNGEFGDLIYRATSRSCYDRDPLDERHEKLDIDQREALRQWADGIISNYDLLEKEAAGEAIIDRILPGMDFQGAEAAEDALINTLFVSENGDLCVRKKYNSEILKKAGEIKFKGKSWKNLLSSYERLLAATDNVLSGQMNGIGDNSFTECLAELNAAYDSFVGNYGYISRRGAGAVANILDQDKRFGTLLGLEIKKTTTRADGKVITSYEKSDIFTKRIIGSEDETPTEDIRDAFKKSYNKLGRIDTAYIADILHSDEASVRDGLISGKLAYEDPNTGYLLPFFIYLSGDVRSKLYSAMAANGSGRYDDNIEALKAVLPEKINYGGINFNFGSTWYDGASHLYSVYIFDKYKIPAKETSFLYCDKWQVTCNYTIGLNAESQLKGRRLKMGPAELLDKAINNTALKPDDFAIKDLTLAKLCDLLLSDKTPLFKGLYAKRGEIEALYYNDKHRLFREMINYAKSKNTEIDITETTGHDLEGGIMQKFPLIKITDLTAFNMADSKVNEIYEDFQPWLIKHLSKPENRNIKDDIEKTFNDKFNSYVPMRIPEEFLPDKLPGQAAYFDDKPFEFKNHQKQAIYRSLMQPTFLAHEVGTGKTLTMAGAAMEMRRLGLAKKPMAVVQKSTVTQFVSQAKRAFPNARIFYLDERDNNPAGRQQFFYNIKYNDFDLVVIGHSTLDLIDDEPKRKKAYIQDKIEEIKETIEFKINNKIRVSDSDNAQLEYWKKQLEKIKDSDHVVVINNTDTEITRKLDRVHDQVNYFSDLGIDALFIDEAHNYKHIGFATYHNRIKGIDNSGTAKCMSLCIKMQDVFERTGHRNVIFATGTPISNQIPEAWVWLKYLLPQERMKDLCINTFDSFLHNFCVTNAKFEYNINGKYMPTLRLREFKNLPEFFSSAWCQMADTVLNKDFPELQAQLPKLKDGKNTDIYLDRTEIVTAAINTIRHILETYEQDKAAYKNIDGNPLPIPLIEYGKAKSVSVDARLVVDDAPDDPGSKCNEAVRQIIRILNESDGYNGTIAIFCENINNNYSGFNLFEDIRDKLILYGRSERCTLKDGLAPDKIAVISANLSQAKKESLFQKTNAGEVRVILGSTATLGTGVNIQERLKAVIHLDAPQRPMDYNQRNGRLIRQGNIHKDLDLPVEIMRLTVRDTSDITAYDLLNTKSQFANAIMNSKEILADPIKFRSIEFADDDDFGDVTSAISGSKAAIKKAEFEKKLKHLKAQQDTYIHARNAALGSIDDLKTQRDNLSAARDLLNGGINLINSADKSTLRLYTVSPAGSKIKIGEFHSIEDAEYKKMMTSVAKESNDEAAAIMDKIKQNIRDYEFGKVEKINRYVLEIGNLNFEIDRLCLTTNSYLTGPQLDYKFNVRCEKLGYGCNNTIDSIVSSLGFNKHSKHLHPQIDRIINKVVSGEETAKVLNNIQNRLADVAERIAAAERTINTPFDKTEEIRITQKTLEELQAESSIEYNTLMAKYDRFNTLEERYFLPRNKEEEALLPKVEIQKINDIEDILDYVNKDENSLDVNIIDLNAAHGDKTEARDNSKDSLNKDEDGSREKPSLDRYDMLRPRLKL